MFSLKHLQEEQKPWVKHNFGDRPSWMPLLGLIEEVGEFLESSNDADYLDSIADITIFLSDYCSAKEWDIQDLWDARPKECEDRENYRVPTILIGKIAHAHLKTAQGIRVSEDHDSKGKEAASELLAFLEHQVDGDFLKLVKSVWDEVRQRNWKADPVSAMSLGENPAVKMALKEAEEHYEKAREG